MDILSYILLGTWCARGKREIKGGTRNKTSCRAAIEQMSPVPTTTHKGLEIFTMCAAGHLNVPPLTTYIYTHTHNNKRPNDTRYIYITQQIEKQPSDPAIAKTFCLIPWKRKENNR
jgi:hypothetical protein